jgi:hypothetical protein
MKEIVPHLRFASSIAAGGTFPAPRALLSHWFIMEDMKNETRIDDCCVDRR